MSIHSSLKSPNTMKRHRSVLSRLERVKILQDKGLLDLQSACVSGLPKVKHLKIRIKKEKAATAAGGTQAAAGSGQPAASAAQPAAGSSKASAGKVAAPKAAAASKASEAKK